MEIKFEPEFSLNLKRDMWFRRKQKHTHTHFTCMGQKTLLRTKDGSAVQVS